IPVQVPKEEELSGMGAAYAAGLALGLYKREQLFAGAERKSYLPTMPEAERQQRYDGWQHAVHKVLTGGDHAERI
ncbi:MAG: glycerol kinase, partial [Hungatella sp.]